VSRALVLLVGSVALPALLSACPPPGDGGDAGPPPGAVVHVVKGGDGNGSVKSAPEGIDCDTACDAQDLTLDPEVTTLTLTATPARDALLEEWRCEGTKDGEPLSTVVVQTADVVAFDDDDPEGVDVTCTATFRQLWTLLVVFSGTGSGHVTGTAPLQGGGTRIDCPDACVAGYFDGDSETLHAVPDTGSVFAGWKLDCSGAGDVTVTLDEDKNCEAHFCPENAPGCP
jgi:hypothetical protein